MTRRARPTLKLDQMTLMRCRALARLTERMAADYREFVKGHDAVEETEYRVRVEAGYFNEYNAEVI